MHQHRERGAISLFWTAVVAGLVAAIAMAALFSMRYERNLFAEGWSRLAGQSPIQDAAKAIKPADAGIRKCVVNGSVVYSNVDCKASDPSSRKVELQDTRGFEAPKAPASASAQGSASASLQEKMIEKATSQ